MYEVVITVVGNVVTEPQTTSTPSGATLTTFRLASAERPEDRQNGQFRGGESLMLQVRCWRGLALNASSLTKGSPVIVQGRLRQRTIVVDGPQGPQRRIFVDLDAVSLGIDLARAVLPAQAEPSAPDQLVAAA